MPRTDDFLDRFAQCVRQPTIALDEATILIGAHAYPDLDVDVGLADLDEIARKISDRSVEGLVAHLFGANGYAGHREKYYEADNSYLHRVLQRRLGIPISLAVLAIEVGRRLDVGLHGIGFPGHFLLRPSTGEQRFIDPFGAGRVLTEGECVVWFHRQHANARWHREYLQPVDSEAILIRMLNNLLAIFQRQRDFASVRWVMQLRCALPNATDEQHALFARVMAPLN